MIARGQPITAADLAPLATLANANLLPLVNALIASNDWIGTQWDVANPSAPPAYLPQPAFTFSGDDWADQMARMRADLIRLFTGKKADGITPLNAGAYQNAGLLLSGPWVVGVNDPDTFPAANGYSGSPSDGSLNPAKQGILYQLNQNGAPSFRSLEFWFALEDGSDGLTVEALDVTGELLGSWSTIQPADGLHLYSNIGRIICDDVPGTFQWNITPPKTKGIWIAKTFPIPAMNRFLDQDTPPYVGRYVTPGEWNGAGGLSGEQATIAIGFPAWSGLLFDGLALPVLDNPPAAGSRADVNTTRMASSMRQENLINTGTKNITLDLSGIPLWSGAATYGAGVEVKDVAGNVWLSLQPGNLNHAQVEGMWWHLVWPAGTSTGTEPKYNLIGASGQCKPSSWLVRRDTDFVPWNLGFNSDDSMRILSNASGLVAPKNGSYWADAFPSISNQIRKVSIQVLAPGTTNPGWANGQFQYGAPLATTLLIFVANSSIHSAFNPADPTTYDFFTATNQVNIPGDGGVGYLAKIVATEDFVGFNYFICQGIPRGAYNSLATYHAFDLVTDPAQPSNTYKFINSTPTAGAALNDGDYWALTQDVAFDLVTQWSTSPNPRRGYFPQYSECYSFIPSGALWGRSYTLPHQPVPQNGYCIFKVRATRLPVTDSRGLATTPTSGPEIVVTLGQMKMQLDGALAFQPLGESLGQLIGAGDGSGAGDGTSGAGGVGSGPITVTIPAIARDSGDVNVFIPVLGGNELVWQAATGVILEAWANWQPKFNGRCYAALRDMFGTYQDSSPLLYDECLLFKNAFNPGWANYKTLGPSDTLTEFLCPPTIELYDDLYAAIGTL